MSLVLHAVRPKLYERTNVSPFTCGKVYAAQGMKQIRHFVVIIRAVITQSFTVMDCAASKQETTQRCQAANRLCMVGTLYEWPSLEQKLVAPPEAPWHSEFTHAVQFSLPLT